MKARARRLRGGLSALGSFGIALALCGALAAQEAVPVDLAEQLPADWQGSCDLVVVTSDEEGQPVGGVQVGLRLGESTSMLRGLVTDAEGRLALTGLAAGEWQVELQREGFMLYTAYLKLETGKEPEVGFKSRQRTGSFWAPLEAVFLTAEDRITPAVRVGRKSTRQAEKEAREREKREEQARRRQEREVERGRAARLVASEAPEPEPVPAEPDSVPAEADSITAEPDRAAPATPDPPVTDRPSARPVPAVPAPTPPPPDAPATPRLLPNPDLLPAGACPECRPDEWSVSTQSVAAPSGSCASGDVSATMDRVADELARHLTGPLAGYAGAVWARDGNDALRLLPEALEQELRALVEPAMGVGTSCPVVAIVLPADARYVGFRYAAGQRSTMAECPPGQGCLIGEASWTGNPTIREAGAVRVVWSRFENASAQRERAPRLTVYFEPARGWLPPSR